MLVSWTQSTWLQQNLSFNPNHGNSSFDPPLACEILQCMFLPKNVVFLFCCNIAGLIFFRFSRFRSIYFYGAPEIQETSFSDVKGPINVISIYIYIFYIDNILLSQNIMIRSYRQYMSYINIFLYTKIYIYTPYTISRTIMDCHRS